MLAALVVSALRGGGAESLPTPQTADAPKPLDYRLVVTGEELLRGVYPDAHTHFITRTLLPLGGHCLGVMAVDDRPEDIREALRFATNKVRLVIVTGGLGPTVNDVTRGALSDFTGVPLHEQPEVLAEMERRFNTPRDQLRPNLRRQTLVPVRGGYLKNPHGSAVGLVFETNGVVLVALPGPPRELQPMVTTELIPYLRRKFGTRPIGASLTLRFVGLGQSAIDQTLREKCAAPADVIVTSLFEGGRVDFSFFLPGNTPADHARLKALEACLRQHLGDYFYADDGASLEDLTLAVLRSRGETLALAEVASGGSLAVSLLRAPGADRVLTGTFAAPTLDALRRLLDVPDETWKAASPGEAQLKVLGRAAQQRARSRWAVVVGARDAGASGSSQVWVAFAGPDDRWQFQRLPLAGAGESAQTGLITQLLDRFRRMLK